MRQTRRAQHPSGNTFFRMMNKRTIKPTRFGSVCIVWTRINGNPKIFRIVLSRPGTSAEDQASALYPNPHASSCAEIDRVATAIEKFLEGEEIELSLDAALTLLLGGIFGHGFHEPLCYLGHLYVDIFKNINGTDDFFIVKCFIGFVLYLQCRALE